MSLLMLAVGIYFLVGVLVRILIQHELLDKKHYGVPKTLEDIAAISTLTEIIFILLWPIWLLVGLASKKSEK